MDPENLAERRQLSVMFCDLVGSTALSSTLDAEDLRDIIRAYQRACAEVIVRYEGFVAQYLGDGIMAYFGYPRAHENDAENAVRAGLALIDAVAELRIGRPAMPRLRIGIATGLAVVGDLLGEGAATERAIVGATPNLAARVQGLAQADTVVIARSTRQLLGAQFEYEDLGAQALKGFEQPVQVWRVMGERPIESRFDAVRTSELTTLVDRVDERRLLQSQVDRVLAGQGSVALLEGEAGIGKSRIARALFHATRESQRMACWEIQCSPYHAHSPLFPLIETLQRQIFLGSRPRSGAAQWESLRAYLGETASAGEEALSLLADLLSIPTPAGHPALALAPDRRKQMTQQLLLSLATQRAGGRPVLLLVEDVHWADPSTLEFLDFLVEQASGEPLWGLFTFRPEFIPRWEQKAHVLHMRIGRLSTVDAVELIARCSGASRLTPDTIKRVVEKTDGVPLYLEEFTKTVIESARTVSGGGPIAESTIPGTLRDSLQARLDHLGAAKALAQLASVMGREFSVDLLRAVWTGSAEALRAELGRLASSGFITPGAVVGQDTFLFKHALIQDAAYESMLKATRVKLHRHVAEAIEREFPDLVATQPERLAQHYTAGRVPEKAVPFWLVAGRQALGRNAHIEAVAHLRSGLAALAELPDSPERALVEMDLQLTLGPALMAAKGYASEDVAPTWRRAEELCAMVGDPARKIVALFGLWTFNAVRANHLQALALTDQCFELARATGSEDLFLAAHLIRGISEFFLGRVDLAATSLEACISLYDPVRHRGHAYQFGQDPAVAALAYLSWLHWLKGDRAKAIDSKERGLALARSLNHPFTLSFVLSFASWLHMDLREYADADRHIREVVQLCVEQEIQVFLAHARTVDGWFACQRVSVSDGVGLMQAGLDFFVATGSRCFLPYWYTLHARECARAGDKVRAERCLAQAFAAMEGSGERWPEAELHRTRGLFLADSEAGADEVERCYRQALDVATRQGASVFAVRAATSLGQHLMVHGRAPEARALVHGVLSGLAHNPGDADFSDAREFLDSIDTIAAHPAGGPS